MRTPQKVGRGPDGAATAGPARLVPRGFGGKGGSLREVGQVCDVFAARKPGSDGRLWRSTIYVMFGLHKPAGGGRFGRRNMPGSSPHSVPSSCRRWHQSQTGAAPRRGGPTITRCLRSRTRRRVHRQNHRRPRLLVEVEVRAQVAELRIGLANVGTRVRPAVCGGIEALRAEEVVLDELVEGVMTQRLVIDVALTGVGADDQSRGRAAHSR